MIAPTRPASGDRQIARIRGLLVGLMAGLETSFGAGPEARVERDLLAATIRGLSAPEIDFERMVADWVATGDGRSADPATASVLDWLARNRRPPGPEDVAASPAALLRALPVAVLAAGAPMNLLSGSYHLAALWTGDPATQWAAVAVNVAAAQFLLGRKDFVPDVIEALRVNDAPGSVIDAVRRIPFAPWSALDSVDVALPVGCMEAALFVAHREPHVACAVHWLRRRGARWLEPLGLALLGARDGDDALGPGLWESAEIEHEVERVIAQLMTPKEPT
jgi:hypothetical protein